MARSFTYDQEKVKALRMSIVDAVQLVMEDDASIEKWSAYKKEMVLKMSPRILPQISEVSGPDGGPVEVTGVDIIVRK